MSMQDIQKYSQAILQKKRCINGYMANSKYNIFRECQFLGIYVTGRGELSREALRTASPAGLFLLIAYMRQIQCTVRKCPFALGCWHARGQRLSVPLSLPVPHSLMYTANSLRVCKSKGYGYSNLF